MTTRADRYTQLQKLPDTFSDLLTGLTPHPITKDVGRVRNDQSVKQALKNLILTTYGERPFQPDIGSNIYRSLFEPNDDFLVEDIEGSVRTAIEAKEPRVFLNEVRVVPNEDTMTITIVFSLINTRETQSFDVILRRVR